jgi:hypothetical protein
MPIIAAFEDMFVSFEMDSQKLPRRIDREDNLVLIAYLRLGEILQTTHRPYLSDVKAVRNS